MLCFVNEAKMICTSIRMSKILSQFYYDTTVRAIISQNYYNHPFINHLLFAPSSGPKPTNWTLAFTDTLFFCVWKYFYKLRYTFHASRCGINYFGTSIFGIHKRCSWHDTHILWCTDKFRKKLHWGNFAGIRHSWRVNTNHTKPPNLNLIHLLSCVGTAEKV